MTDDPYTPPKRHRDSSGALVRVAIIAVLLGGAVWAYTQYDSTGPGLVAEKAETQQMADAGGNYAVTPTPETAAPTAPAPAPATPAAPQQQPRSAPAPEPQPSVPPPSTTIGAPPAG
jgi:hypothetical protein